MAFKDEGAVWGLGDHSALDPEPAAGAERARTSAAWPMLRVLESLWTLGIHGQPPQRVRQIVLTNQIALFASAITLPYQIFYLTYDVRLYWPVLIANLLFTALYLSALPLNRGMRFDAARNLVIGTVYVQLFVVTYFISTGPGVHLFYFSLGASLGMLFATRREPTALLLMGLASVLYLLCQQAFPPGATLLPVPEPIAGVMYAASATGAVFLAGGFSYLFRREIDRAELALTRSNRELERLSGLDALTGLPNRRVLDVHLAHEWARLQHAQTLSVLLCDIDCFKAYNDSYGHVAGDACLRSVATALQEVARRSGDLVARYGGEEFVLVLSETGSEGAMEVARRACHIVMGLEVPHDHSDAAAVVTLSIGVATGGPLDVESPEELLRRADSALYAAKRSGKNDASRWSPRSEDGRAG